jgi:hypothetical protein
MHVPWSAHEYEGTRMAPRKKSRFGPGFPSAAFVRLWRSSAASHILPVQAACDGGL